MLNLASLPAFLLSIDLLISPALCLSQDSILDPDADTSLTSLTAARLPALAPPPAACVPPPPGLVSWWRGQTNTLDDWDSNNGVFVPFWPPGGVTYATGKVGMAFASFFNVEDSESLRVVNSLTIEAWVFLNSTFDNGNHTILSKYAAPSDISYLLGCTNRTLYLHVSPSGALLDSVRLIAPQPLPLATWVHVAGTYDGSAL